MTDKKILDACCGGKMMWFDKHNPNVIFQDIREDDYVLCDGRTFSVKPDIIADFRSMPYPDNSFYLVVFDPPHMDNSNDNSYMAQKYGTLRRFKWQDDLKQGFNQCMRVLKPNGILIFKWNETRIPLSRILEIIEIQPLFCHKSGKSSKTHWLCFMKEAQ